MSVTRGREFPPDSLRTTGGSIPSLSTGGLYAVDSDSVCDWLW